ncbi:hypothetical protein [Sorangium sp. So ce1024]|uniref:hypothetical protein n=1 Tax=Sorangium sp. So ce1024 TaxID=3133327 RepID=UPI003EFD6B4F
MDGVGANLERRGRRPALLEVAQVKGLERVRDAPVLEALGDVEAVLGALVHATQTAPGFLLHRAIVARLGPLPRTFSTRGIAGRLARRGTQTNHRPLAPHAPSVEVTAATVNANTRRSSTSDVQAGAVLTSTGGAGSVPRSRSEVRSTMSGR